MRSYPRPRSGAEAGRTPCPKGSGQEELPHVRGRGSAQECQAEMAQERLRSATLRPRSVGQPRGTTPRPRSGVAAKRSYPTPPRLRPGEAAWRSIPMHEARGGGREYQPHAQGAMAAWAQEGLEELSHVEGQEGRR